MFTSAISVFFIFFQILLPLPEREIEQPDAATERAA